MWRGIAEVLARLVRFGGALPYFERARRLMQIAARALDVVWCLAWEALCLLHLGRPAEGSDRGRQLQSVRPPSTRMTSPVTNPAWARCSA